MLRTFWFYLTFLTLTPIVCTWMLLVGRFDGGFTNRFIALLWCRIALWSGGIRMKADMSAVPGDGPFVFLVNHQSQFDIPITMTALSHWHPAFVAKKSLFRIPLLGWCFAQDGHIAIDRSNRRKAMRSMDHAAEVAQNGRGIIVFPEGTRQKQLDELGECKSGGIVLALKTGLPVVPLVIEGAGDILPAGQIMLSNRSDVTIKALPPIEPDRYTLKERNQFRDEVWGQMNETYKEMRQCRNRTNS